MLALASTSPSDVTIVGDEDADPRVARIVAVDEDGDLDLEVLDGSVESHADLLAPA